MARFFVLTCLVLSMAMATFANAQTPLWDVDHLEKLIPQNGNANTTGIEQMDNNPFFPSDHAMFSVILEILKKKK